MYRPNGKEKLVVLKNLPKSEPGAPSPMVLSDEHSVVVGYTVFDANQGDRWESGATEWVDVPGRIGLVKFRGFTSFLFGAPNEDVIEGHPLHKIGLEPNANYRVENSPWIQDLERMNSVHYLHDKKRYASLNHYILTFHDTTFECVSPDISCLEEVIRGFTMLKMMEDFLNINQALEG
jgi:hypothetical protein